MIVVDASAMVELLLQTSAAPAIEAAIIVPDRTLHAPHLIDIDIEIASVVRRLAGRGEIDAARGRLMLDALRDLPLERHAHALLLPRIWHLRENVTAYDAAYVALAEILDAPLLTRDARLARAAGHLIAVELI